MSRASNNNNKNKNVNEKKAIKKPPPQQQCSQKKEITKEIRTWQGKSGNDTVRHTSTSPCHYPGDSPSGRYKLTHLFFWARGICQIAHTPDAAPRRTEKRRRRKTNLPPRRRLHHHPTPTPTFPQEEKKTKKNTPHEHTLAAHKYIAAAQKVTLWQI